MFRFCCVLLGLILIACCAALLRPARVNLSVPVAAEATYLDWLVYDSTYMSYGDYQSWKAKRLQ